MVRTEGQGPLLETNQVAEDVNRIYMNASDVSHFLWNAFGRDSIDGRGLPLVATVNSTAVGSCPSAFWSSSFRQTVYCLGQVPDDCVAREFTHGLTEPAANLHYQNQSASLHESFSFVFGESVDLVNGGAEVAGEIAGPPAWSGTGVDSGLDQGSSNPIAGEQVFSSHSGGWGVSISHLGAFVSGGESIQLRFELGKGRCSGGEEWYLDEIRVT